MAVTLNANSTADAENDTATTIDNTSLTIAAGSNIVLIAQIAWSLHTVSGVTVAWDPTGANQALTLIGAVNNTTTNGRVALYGLVAPTTGNKTLRASFTGTSNICLNGIAFNGADQTGGATTFPHFNSATGTSTAPSVAVTSAVGNMTVDCTVNDASQYNSSGQTITFNDASPSLISGAGSRGTGAASVTHSWVLNVTGAWASVGCDILAAGGGATRGLFRTPPVSGIGIGGSFFRDPLQGAWR